ncbi:hypothetical protein MASR2M47_10780 [Draconibacterium sp.]
MTNAELTDLMDSWENLQYLAIEIAHNQEHYKLLMEIALFDTNPKSWRAAYLVDKINDERPELLIPFLNELIQQVQIEKSTSKKRHFLKLISLKELIKLQQGSMFDFCTKTLVSDDPVAVRVHAMQILHNIAENEPELIPEVVLLIQNEMEKRSSAGIISRGKRLVAKLEIITNKN